jgi:hypothetical protein
MNDLDLLRTYEPVLCYTRGEQFFPIAIDGYLRRASMWALSTSGPPRKLVAEGALDEDRLAREVDAVPNATFYLRFTDRPLEIAEYQRWRRDRGDFRAPGRLTRVGLSARIVDSFFDISLLVRGRVPGGATSIAAAKYRDIQRADKRHVYYGRVVRVGGYIVLNYWFFYAMNPWRSGFFGANDHEADWEQIFVYLSDEGDRPPEPRWAAYAQHDFAGDDLRRRWDDPELQRTGNHPIVFCGAGSHASYFEPGEYLMGVQPAVLRPARVLVGQVRQFWAQRLGQGAEDIQHDTTMLFSVPFVDYARGDGMRIGPGEDAEWSPEVLRDEAGWVDGYRGLWGLDTRDPFGGERAPSGPKYNRDGSVRRSWFDPLGWSGLDKVSPPSLAARDLEHAIELLEDEQSVAAAEIEDRRAAARRLALEQAPHRVERGHDDQLLTRAELELRSLVEHASDLDERLRACRRQLEQLTRGEPTDPQAHILHKHRPEAPLAGRAGLVEFWSAISAGVLIATLGVLVVLAPAGWPWWVLVAICAALTIDAIAQHHLVQLLLNATVVLAVISTLVLLKEFWQPVIIVGLVAFLITLAVQNLDELRHT